MDTNKCRWWFVAERAGEFVLVWAPSAEEAALARVDQVLRADGPTTFEVDVRKGAGDDMELVRVQVSASLVPPEDS